jgi:hypothetical protein
MTPAEVAEVVEHVRADIQEAVEAVRTEREVLKPLPPRHRFTVWTNGRESMGLTVSLGGFAYHLLYTDGGLSGAAEERHKYHIAAGSKVAVPVITKPEDLAQAVLSGGQRIALGKVVEVATARAVESARRRERYREPLPLLNLFPKRGEPRYLRSYRSFIRRYDGSRVRLGSSYGDVEAALGSAKVSSTQGGEERRLYGNIGATTDLGRANYVEARFREGRAVAVFSYYQERP